MAKKKKPAAESKDDDVPDGKVDEDGDELIDLYTERDDLTDDVIYEIPDDDDMIADEDEDEEFGPEPDEAEAMLRAVKCDPCPGLKSNRNCQVARDYGCPKPKSP